MLEREKIFRITHASCGVMFGDDMEEKRTYAVGFSKGIWRLKVTVKFWMAKKPLRTAIDLPAEIPRTFLDGLAKERIPLVVDYAMGCDGETVELELGDFWGGVKLCWWSVAPPEWENVQELVEDFCRSARELLESKKWPPVVCP